MLRNNIRPYIIIILIGCLLFLPFLGAVPLFDWDEANFAEAAREMIATGNYMRVHIDFMPFWEKPPVFIWLQAAAMQLFGVNEFAARLPNAVTGIVTLCCVYYIGNKVSKNRLGKWWVGLYIASWLPHFYFKTAIIDPLFNLFIFLAVYQVYAIQYGRKALRHALLSGIFLGLAVLTKGPAAILIALLTFGVFIVLSKFRTGIHWKHLLVIALGTLLTTFTWFGADIIRNGWWFTREFITYQIRLFSTEDAGHGGPFFYHWIVLLIGCFPAAAFLFQYVKGQNKILMLTREKAFHQLMWALFGVVLILFSIVKTKIVHYSSLCYLPLTFLAAAQLQWWYEKKRSLLTVTKVMFLFTGLLLCVAIALLPIAGQNLHHIQPYVKDTFAAANMNAQVTWHTYEAIIGLAGAAGILYAWKRMKKDVKRGFAVLVLSQAVVIFTTMFLFVPRIEQYSQHAAIDFYRQHSDGKAYVHPLGFKSYAYLFYSQKQAVPDSAYYDNRTGYFLSGKADRPVFFISKNIQEQEWLQDPRLEKTGEQNGYVFYRLRQE